MATSFKDGRDDLMVIVPPNSEAINNAQRFGMEERSVGSYYVSNKARRVIDFLANFQGRYLIDLAYSYEKCRFLYSGLIANCANFYKNGLTTLSRTLSIIQANIESGTDDYLFFSPDELALTDSSKYLRMGGSSAYMRYFKELILGDIIEIVFKRVSNDLYIIYLQPHGSIEKWVLSADLFDKWIKANVGK